MNNYMLDKDIDELLNELVDKLQKDKEPKIKLFTEDLFITDIDSNINLDFKIDSPKGIEIEYF